MSSFDWKKRILPDVAVLLFFVVLSFVYCSPVFEGKTLGQLDMIKARGWNVEMRHVIEERSELPLWTNSMFGGMPTYQLWIHSPKNLIRELHVGFRDLFPHPVEIFLLYFGVFYLLLRSIGLNIWLSAAGAIAFGLSSYNTIIIEAGHLRKTYAIAHFGGLIAGVLLCFRGKLLLGGALAAFFGALELDANHYQMTYYLFFLLGFIAIAYLIKFLRENDIKGFLKPIGVLAIAGCIAVLPNVSQIWTTYEYSQETIRGNPSELTAELEKGPSGLSKDYVFAWSHGPLETMTILIPNLYGGGSGENIGEGSHIYQRMVSQGVNPAEARRIASRAPMYWGDQPFTSGPVYFGAIVCFLFVLGLIIVKGYLKWALVGATILTVLLSWGDNLEWFNDLFYYHFPMYNKFRTVSSILVIPSVTFPLLGFLALKHFYSLKGTQLKAKKQLPEVDELLKALKISAGIVGGLCVAFFLLGPVFLDFRSAGDANLPDWLTGALIDDRVSALRMDAARSLFFIAATAGLLWAYLQNKISARNSMLAIGILVLVDLWGVSKRYLNNDHFVTKAEYCSHFQPTQADLTILQNEGFASQETFELPPIGCEMNQGFRDMALNSHFRVMNFAANTWNETKTSIFHKSIGGYHAAKLRRIQELYEYQIARQNFEVLNMLNTRYFIFSPEENAPPRAQQNPDALGPAWFVDEIRFVENADEEMEALGNFDPSRTALVDKRFSDKLSGLNISPNPNDQIELVDYMPHHLTYAYTSANERLAVFSEMYYDGDKGWKAFVNGEELPIIRVNYALRAIRLPAGNHTVEMQFEPRSFVVGERISLAGSLIILLLLAGSIFYEWRRQNAL